MATSSNYRLGSIWIVSFDPSVGTEIRKTRPALVISGTIFNENRSKITVLPFTSAKSKSSKLAPAIVTVSPSTQNGLSVESWLICVDPMTFDKDRLIKFIGNLEEPLLQQAQNTLRQYLSL
ncbi:type II toxin-antitoxin system PemK/MazF family toxin [Spirulina sp. CS-785/01]|uniref:type II toxin-antitoxin system PemK/MazF family toxin n=1 Tax=Spirulina sp. CS-785/01 TaxID=3021716 RepID=UPI00232F8475|nr:type II toxin-antitoxin system PemK/MazF family toxin [Spirulina sp. CS-785/01]MDB9314320.1 type II toxin-antitoxin system PemK/MazF family toxin [Spirulina sp. CS-785/01]